MLYFVQKAILRLKWWKVERTRKEGSEQRTCIVPVRYSIKWKHSICMTRIFCLHISSLAALDDKSCVSCFHWWCCCLFIVWTAVHKRTNDIQVCVRCVNVWFFYSFIDVSQWNIWCMCECVCVCVHVYIQSSNKLVKINHLLWMCFLLFLLLFCNPFNVSSSGCKVGIVAESKEHELNINCVVSNALHQGSWTIRGMTKKNTLGNEVISAFTLG